MKSISINTSNKINVTFYKQILQQTILPADVASERGERSIPDHRHYSNSNLHAHSVLEVSY